MNLIPLIKEEIRAGFHYLPETIERIEMEWDGID